MYIQCIYTCIPIILTFSSLFFLFVNQLLSIKYHVYMYFKISYLNYVDIAKIVKFHQYSKTLQFSPGTCYRIKEKLFSNHFWQFFITLICCKCLGILLRLEIYLLSQSEIKLKENNFSVLFYNSFLKILFMLGFWSIRD